MALAHILTASLLAPVALGFAGTAVAVAQPGAAGPDHVAPQVALWTNKGDDVFTRGDAMTVFLRTDVDAFVSVFHVDADGLVRVLFPRTPFDDAFAPGGQSFAVPGTHAGYTLRVDEYPGEGFLFAVVTLDPIAFGAFSRNGAWDYAALGLPARVTDDPYVLFSALLAALVPETYEAYGYAVTPYYVDAQHGYPRFLCYQCHAYVPPTIWDPYAHSCIRVRVSEPAWWRYPGEWYGGTVVVPPPRAVPPRYVLEPRQAEPVTTTGPRDRRPAASPGTVIGRRPAPAVSDPSRRGHPATPARAAPASRPPTRKVATAAPATRPAEGARPPSTRERTAAASGENPGKSGQERGDPGARSPGGTRARG
jgi:hypothetical protein